jgi:hypothetical protein
LSRFGCRVCADGSEVDVHTLAVMIIVLVVLIAFAVLIGLLQLRRRRGGVVGIGHNR